MEVYGRTGYLVTVGQDNLKVRRAGEKDEQLIVAQKVPSPYDDSLTFLRAVLLDGAKPDASSPLETNVIVTKSLMQRVNLLPPARLLTCSPNKVQGMRHLFPLHGGRIS